MWIGDVPDRTRAGILHIRSFQIESGAVKRIEELGGAAMGWRRRRLNPGNRRGTESFGGGKAEKVNGSDGGRDGNEDAQRKGDSIGRKADRRPRRKKEEVK